MNNTALYTMIVLAGAILVKIRMEQKRESKEMLNTIIDLYQETFDITWDKVEDVIDGRYKDNHINIKLKKGVLGLRELEITQKH